MPGKIFSQTPDSLKDSIQFYVKIGQFEKAIPFAERRIEKRRAEKGEQSIEYAASLNSLGDLFIRCRRVKEALPYLRKGLDIWKATSHEKDPTLSIPYNTLGLYYFTIGDYRKAEPYYIQALEIRKETMKEENPAIAACLDNLGSTYQKLGDFGKAEKYLLESLELRKKHLGQTHPNVATSCNNVAILFLEMGNFSKSESFYLQAIEIGKKELIPDHPVLAIYNNNLGGLYRVQKKFALAEWYELESLRIRKKNLHENDPDLSVSYNSLGSIYSDIGNFKKAEFYFLKTLENLRLNFSENHIDLAAAKFNLGALANKTKKFRKAENLVLEAFLCRKRVLGDNHPLLAETAMMLGDIYLNLNDYKKAEAFFLWANEKNLEQTRRYFPFLSSFEKEKFYENIKNQIDRIESFCVENCRKNPALIGHLYTQKLATKAILLNSSQKFKRRFRSINDTSIQKQFHSWEEKTSEIARIYSGSDSLELNQLRGLEDQAEKLEKELSNLSYAFSELAEDKNISWKSVQKKLRPEEAAIELVRIRKFGSLGQILDTSDSDSPTYPIKGLNDTTYYAALIVKPYSKLPDIVLLKDGNQFENKWIHFYRNNISKNISDRISYNIFWKKIGLKLGRKVKRVFVSPDGIYNSINLNTLINPETGKYLLDELEIRMVTNTRELLKRGPSKSNAAFACLVGYPDYNAGKEKPKEMLPGKEECSQDFRGSAFGRNDSYSRLPGTKVEVEIISKLMIKKGWQVESFIGGQALEESVKETKKPRVLHIATHGFFKSDYSTGSNPLLHSGLLLAGANKTLAGEENEMSEDGILTAYEAMNLNLDNTDLVVLSACETGLGEIKNGEGVYGLQRAFKVAGAKSIIMSLWKVDDEATQELMVSFYKHWLGEAVGEGRQTANGNSKRSAFLKAQKELKAKYPNPYYWGAFVMVGE